LVDEDEDEAASGGPPLILDEVIRAWPQFLSVTQRHSKQTAVMMEAAMPVAVSGGTVTLAFAKRSNLEIMNQPKKVEFVRKVLALVLRRDAVAVKFVLDDAVTPAPTRSSSSEKKRVRDPLAELLEMSGPGTALPAPEGPAGRGGGGPFGLPAPADDFGLGFSGGSGYGAHARALPAATYPPPAPRQDSGITTASNAPARDFAREAPAPAWPPREREPAAPLPAAGSGGAAAAHRQAAALDDPLVQEVLSVFGGEVLTED